MRKHLWKGHSIELNTIPLGRCKECPLSTPCTIGDDALSYLLPRIRKSISPLTYVCPRGISSVSTIPTLERTRGFAGDPVEVYLQFISRQGSSIQTVPIYNIINPPHRW